jgi:hypothetical protein
VAFAASYASSPRAAEPGAADRFDGGEDAAPGEKKLRQRPKQSEEVEALKVRAARRDRSRG